jgi:hypothetical protein
LLLAVDGVYTKERCNFAIFILPYSRATFPPRASMTDRLDQSFVASFCYVLCTCVVQYHALCSYVVYIIIISLLKCDSVVYNFCSITQTFGCILCSWILSMCYFFRVQAIQLVNVFRRIDVGNLKHIFILECYMSGSNCPPRKVSLKGKHMTNPNKIARRVHWMQGE